MEQEHAKKIYIRLRHRIQVKMNQKIRLNQICQMIVHPSMEQKVKNIEIHQVTSEDRHLVVIDIMKVIHDIKQLNPTIEVESYGPPQCILEIMHPSKTPKWLFVLGVWLLLFVGSGLAIMNFHEDVNMLEVHQKIYKMMTGEEQKHPLLLQIPYSIGIGVGMILFFNHVFKKRLNEEPSPLEVEMFLYQQNLDQYVVMNENKEVQRKLDDTS